MNRLDNAVQAFQELNAAEVAACLYRLLREKRLDVLTLNTIYNQYLQDQVEDYKLQVMEAGACLVEDLMIHKQNRSSGKKRPIGDEPIGRHIQRALYFLNNQSRSFNVDQLNRDLGYMGNEEASALSAYHKWRKK